MIPRTTHFVGSVGTIDPKKALPPGVYSVKFANGLWTGIEIKAGETTVIEPAYLKIETPAKDNLYLLDAETGDELGGFFMEAAPWLRSYPGGTRLAPACRSCGARSSSRQGKPPRSGRRSRA